MIDNDKDFPIKKKDGNIKGKLGIVSYREKGTSDENEIDEHLKENSNLILYKEEHYIEDISNPLCILTCYQNTGTLRDIESAKHCKIK